MSVVIKANANPLIRYGASFASVANLAANGSVQVFAPASNVAGAIVWNASMFAQAASGFPGLALIAKSGAAPTLFTDGACLMSAQNAYNNGSHAGEAAALTMPIFIPVGMGLWFFATNADNHARRSCLYNLL